MFVRFQAAVLLVVLAAVAASTLERAILDHRRAIGRQHYQIEELRERIARARLQAECLTAFNMADRPRHAQSVQPASRRTHHPVRTASNPGLPWRAIAGEQ